MYFENLPTILLDSASSTDYRMVTDITARIIGSMEIRNNVFLYEYIDILDSDRPETVSFKVYGDSKYHWVILLCNDIIDPIYDWVLSNDILLTLAIATYGEEGIFHTHHYEDEYGNWVDSSFPNARQVTYIQYLENENEKKRKVKVLQPRYLAAFVDEFKTRLRERVE